MSHDNCYSTCLNSSACITKVRSKLKVTTDPANNGLAGDNKHYTRKTKVIKYKTEGNPAQGTKDPAASIAPSTVTGNSMQDKDKTD